MRIKIVRVMAIVLLLCLPVQFAMGEGFTRETWYEMGLSALEEMTAESTEEALDCFNAAGKYEQAQNLKTYARSLLAIFSIADGSTDLSLITFQLKDLAKQAEFVELLTAHDLPSCESLIQYTEAFRTEQAGQYNDARKQYAAIRNVLDAQDRMYDLTPKAYDQAKALYEQENYEAAVDIFNELDFKDSAEMAQQAFQHMPHEWVEANCTQPRTCTRHHETEGEPLGHDWAEATCTEPRRCNRCGITEGEPLGHDWQEATYEAPRTCRRCGITEGEPLTKKANQPEITSVSWNAGKRAVDLTFSKNESAGPYMCVFRYGTVSDQAQEETGRRVGNAGSDPVSLQIMSDSYLPGKWQTFRIVEMDSNGAIVSASDPVEFQIPENGNVSSIIIESFAIPDTNESDLQQMVDELRQVSELTIETWKEIVVRYTRADVAFSAPVKVLLTAPSGKAFIFSADEPDSFYYLFGLSFTSSLPVEAGTYTIEFYDEELMCPVQGGTFTMNVIGQAGE